MENHCPFARGGLLVSMLVFGWAMIHDFADMISNRLGRGFR